jgi:hypothetical protein
LLQYDVLDIHSPTHASILMHSVYPFEKNINTTHIVIFKEQKKFSADSSFSFRRHWGCGPHDVTWENRIEKRKEILDFINKNMEACLLRNSSPHHYYN